MLNNESNLRVEDWLVLNLTYHQLLKDFQKVLKGAQIRLMPNEERKTVFREKPAMIGLRKARTLKDYLERAKITETETPNNVKVPGVTVKVTRFVSILRRLVSLKTLMEISTIFVKELEIVTQILLFTNFTVNHVLNQKKYVGSNITDFRY